jgi:hypothetical protein
MDSTALRYLVRGAFEFERIGINFDRLNSSLVGLWMAFGFVDTFVPGGFCTRLVLLSYDRQNYSGQYKGLLRMGVGFGSIQ